MSTISTIIPNIQAGRAMMNARIASAVSSGEISSTDQSAFATALDSIDSSLSSSSGSSTSSGGIQGRVFSLIDAQVTGGTLTDDQAAELKSLFAPDSQSASGQQGGVQAGGMMPPPPMNGPGGPPPPPPPSDSSSSSSDSSSSSSSSTSSASSTSSTSSTDDELTSMIALLEKLRESLKSNNTYGSTDSSSTGLILNAVA